MTSDRNIAVARVGELWLAATGDGAVTDKSWREYLEMAKASVAANGPFTGLYLYFPKSGPTPAQRGWLTGEYATALRLDKQRRVAMISASAVARGAMTAIAWLTRDKTALRAFSPEASDRSRAFDWLLEDIPFDRAQATDLERAMTSITRQQAAS